MMIFFFDLQSTHETLTYQAFPPFQLLQMSNDHRMVDVEFLSNFSCSSKKISFHHCSQLVIVRGFPGGSDGKESAWNAGDLN